MALHVMMVHHLSQPRANQVDMCLLRGQRNAKQHHAAYDTSFHISSPFSQVKGLIIP